MKLSEIAITPTTACNISCKHCAQDSRIKGMTMEDSVLEKLLLEIKDMDLENIYFSGGEITMDGYRQRLLGAIKNAGFDKDQEILFETNGWWGYSGQSAKKVFREMEDAGVKRLLLSTDSFHEKFIPLENIARVIKASKNSSVDLSNINVRSFKSTYNQDIDLIKRLSKKLGEEVKSTQAHYVPRYSSPSSSIPDFMLEVCPDKRSKSRKILDDIQRRVRYFFNPNFSVRMNGGEGFVDMCEREGGIKGLRNISQIIYSIGKGSNYNPLMGGSGINITQMWATREGVARKNIKRKDEIELKQSFTLPYLIDDKEYLFSPTKRLVFPPRLDRVTIMPDGSIIPNCGWEYQNDYKRARFGVYPKMSLKEFEKTLHSLPQAYKKLGKDILTYLPAVIGHKLKPQKRA